MTPSMKRISEYLNGGLTQILGFDFSVCGVSHAPVSVPVKKQYIRVTNTFFK